MRAFSKNRWSWLILTAFVAGCGGLTVGDPNNTDPANPVKESQTDFVNNEPGSNGSTVGGPRGGDGEFGSAAPAADSASAGANAKAPSGRTGTVEEADIYRIDNNRLFYLNTYKGFIVYDLADPKNPQRVSRLPVYGYPIEMFVSQNTVYALLRDSLYLTQGQSGLEFKRHNVSQLVTIDISDLKNPKVLKTFDIIGELREGVSRKIDNTIYVVSYMPQSYYYWGYPYTGDRTEQAWVYSYNVADPKNPVQVDALKIFEGGGKQSYDAGSYEYRGFSGVAISATANTLHVVENWYHYGYQQGSGKYCSGSWDSSQQAVVSIIDISNPSGAIRLHSRFESTGSLTDQFKHSYMYDPVTQKGYYLGIFARREWGGTNCTGTSTTRNTLEAWDITDGAHPVRVGSLVFGKPDEGVRGSTFDMDRKLVYAITARNVDPLYTISFADPANLKILSAIDGLSGDMSVFRIIGNGKFLLGVGRDNSDACTGFGAPAVGWSTNMAVSIIDVSDATKTRLVQRKCVAVKDAKWVTSQITWNLDQAHKMIGMASDARADVVSVPVSYYAPVNGPNTWWWYRYESAVGIMSYDLAKYDPAKSELNQVVLQNRATVLHENGQVERSIIFTHHGATDRRLMVNLSDTHISVFDIDNLDSPVAQSVVEVAPYHERLFKFGNYVVDQVSQGAQYQYPPAGSEFRVRLAGRNLEDSPVLAAFTVGPVSQVVQYKDNLILFRPRIDTSKGYYGSNTTDLVVFDLSNPLAPKQRGTLELTQNSYGYWPYYCGADLYFYGYYYGYNSSVIDDHGLAQLSWTYTGNVNQRSLQYIDLSNLDKPALQIVNLDERYDYSKYPYVVAPKQYIELVPDLFGKGFYASYRQQIGSLNINNTTFGQQKYFAERWSSAPGAAPTAEAAVNLPGRLVRTWVKGTQRAFLATDTTWSQFLIPPNGSTWRSTTRLHFLLENPLTKKAMLKVTEPLGNSQLGEVVGDTDKLAVTLRPDYWSWYGVADSAQQAAIAADRLVLFDLANNTMVSKFSGALGTRYATLMGALGNQLFVNMPNDGVLVVDIANLTKPTGQHFARTLGYATHLVTSNGFAYIGSGYFGIFELDLNAPVSILAP